MALPRARPYSEVILWLSIWFFDSPTVVFLLKGVLEDFPYPVLLTALTNVVTCIVILGFIQVYDLLSHFQKTKDAAAGGLFTEGGATGSQAVLPEEVSWANSAFLGALQGVEISLANFVLHKLSVALRTELLMTLPLMMFTVACLAGLERPRRMLTLAITLITLGGVLSTSGALKSSNIWVVAVVLLQGLIAVVRWVWTQKCLGSDRENAPSPLRLAGRIVPFTSAIALAGAWFCEPSGFSVLLHRSFTREILGRVIASGCGVAVLMIAELRVVQLTSALLFGIFVPLHNVFIILLGVFLRHSIVTKLNWFGIFVLSCGTGLYTYGRRTEDTEPANTAQNPKDKTLDYHSFAGDVR